VDARSQFDRHTAKHANEFSSTLAGGSRGGGLRRDAQHERTLFKKVSASVCWTGAFRAGQRVTTGEKQIVTFSQFAGADGQHGRLQSGYIYNEGLRLGGSDRKRQDLQDGFERWREHDAVRRRNRMTKRACYLVYGAAALGRSGGRLARIPAEYS